MSKFSSLIRSIVMAALVIIAAFFCGLRLLQTQVVDGAKYFQMTKSVKVTTQEIEAARGQIVDANGKVLNSNKIAHTLSLLYSSLEKGTENEIIYRLVTVLKKNGDKWNDSLPISTSAPYTFLSGRDKDIEKLKKTLNVAGYSTAEDCMHWLCKTYEISDKFDEKMQRYIAGVRYEMTLKEFSEINNKFVMASDVSENAVQELKELDTMLEGVDISENWERQYSEGTTAPHLRGVVGAISEEQYERLKDKGYKANDIIGREGVEKALEDVLHGTRGERTITRSSDETGVKEEITKEPVAGNSVMLTIDSDLQVLVQNALEYHIKYLNSEYLYDGKGGNNYTGLGHGCKSGAIVVLDAKNAGVLASASYPGYEINDMVKDYDEVLNRADAPLLNRALFGEYRPGSTFKTITATAGMAEGVIAPDSRITCAQLYPYYGGKFSCLGAHGAIPVTEALRVSCNIFFYDTARRLGIDKLAEWGKRYGIGEDLGLEIDMATGHMTSLEYFDEMGYEWYEGNIIQAGIGQSETAVTPMHLAVQAMTIANKGVRYEPHIVKSVYNYDLTEKLYDVEPKIAEDFSHLPDMDKYMDTIKQGMQQMADTQVSFDVVGAGFVNTFDYLGFKGKVASKSGTPQTSKDEYNSAFIGFYPADDPQIAFGIILDHGEYSKVLAANVVNAYANKRISTQYDEKGVPKSIL